MGITDMLGPQKCPKCGKEFLTLADLEDAHYDYGKGIWRCELER